MDKKRFNKYSKFNKCKLIQNDAVELDNFITRFGLMKLVTTYSLKHLFIEVFLDLETRNIETIKAYNSSKFLEKYPSQKLRIDKLVTKYI